MLMKTASIYQEKPSPQDDPLTISGRDIAHGKRTAAERSFLAANLHRNRTVLFSPTVKQCAALVGVCVPYVAAAVAIAKDYAKREAVLAGEVTLLDAAKALTSESLAEHFARATPTEWLDAARVIGPAVIWDRMVAPLV